MLWSKEYKELISSHGFAQNQLIIWKYPALTKVAELTGLFIFCILCLLTFVVLLLCLTNAKWNYDSMSCT